MANTKIHQYYIKLQRCSNMEGPSLFVGPFEGEGSTPQDQAKQMIEDWIADGKEVVLVEDSNGIVNPNGMLCATILAKIEARRFGLRSPEMGDSKNTLYKEFPDLEEFDKIETMPIERKGRPRKEKVAVDDEEELEATVVSPKNATTTRTAEKNRKTKKAIEQGGSKMPKNWDDQDIEQALATREVIVLTDRMSIISWLERKGIRRAKIARYVTNEQVQGKVVLGTIPNHAQVGSYLIGNISVPGIPKGKNIMDLSVEELEQYHARIDFYWPVQFAGSIE